MSDNIICPITQCIFLNPVKASDGITYEKDAIEEWYETNKTSPITREELNNIFIDDIETKNIVSDYLEKNPHETINVYKKEIDPNKLLSSSKFKEFLELSEIDMININTDVKFKLFEHLHNNKEDMKLFLSKVKNINYVSKFGIPHFLVSYCKDVELLEIAWQHGANFELDDLDGEKPIIYCCIFNNLIGLQFLINKGVNLEYKTYKNKKPIYYACRYANFDFIKLLMDNIKSNEDIIDNFIVHYLCKNKCLDTIDKFLDNYNLPNKNSIITLNDKYKGFPHFNNLTELDILCLYHYGQDILHILVKMYSIGYTSKYIYDDDILSYYEAINNTAYMFNYIKQIYNLMSRAREINTF